MLQLRYEALRRRFPNTLIALRVPIDADILTMVQAGTRIFHRTADYHGRVGGRFMREAIRDLHERLVAAGVREEITLRGRSFGCRR